MIWFKLVFQFGRIARSTHIILLANDLISQYRLLLMVLFLVFLKFIIMQENYEIQHPSYCEKYLRLQVILIMNGFC